MAGPAEDQDEFAAYREQRRGNGQSQDPAPVDEFAAYQEARGRKKGKAKGPKRATRDQAAGLGFQQGVTFGLADEAAGMKAMLGLPSLPSSGPTGPLTDAVMGLGGLAMERFGRKPKTTSDLITGEDNSLPDSYTGARDARRFAGGVARQDQPVTSFASEVAGSVVYPGGALKLGAPLLGQTAKLGAIGAGQGALYGYAASEGDTQDRENAAKMGAAFGGAAGAVLPSAAATALPVFRAGKTGVAEFADWLVGKFGGTGTAAAGNAEQVAAAAVRRSMERSGMTPEKVMEAIQKFGDKPAVLAEVIGQDAVNALSALTRRPGSTPQKAQALIEERFGGFVDRAQGDLEKATGFKRGDIVAERDAALAERQAAASPVYDHAFETFPKVQSERLAQLGSSSPTLKAYIAKAEKKLADKAAVAGKPVDQMSELDLWDLVKRTLDDDLSDAVARKQLDEVRGLTQIRDAFISELDAVTGGAYAVARDVGGEAPRLRAAFDDGGKALGAQPASEIQRQVNALNPQDAPFYKAGMTANIADRIDKGMTPQRFRVRDTQNKVRAGLGEEEGGSFLGAMEAEASLRETGARWAPRMNSVTGTVLENGPSQLVDDVIGMSADLARGNKIGFATKAVNWMRRRGYNQKQIDAMGDLLLSNPAEGIRRLGIKLPSGTPGAGGGGGAVGQGFEPAKKVPSNALAEISAKAQPTTPRIRTNESGSVRPSVAGGLAGGSGGALVGANEDLTGDGKVDWRDIAFGTGVGTLGGVGLGKGMNALENALNRPAALAGKPKRVADMLPPKPDIPKREINRDMQRRWNLAMEAARKELANRPPLRVVGPDGVPQTTEAEVEELAIQYARMMGVDPAPFIKATAPTADVVPLRPKSPDDTPPKASGLGAVKDELGQQAILAGFGSIGGSANDLNGDGKNDWQDAAIGAAGAMVGVNGVRAVGAARNALAGAGKRTVGKTRTAGPVVPRSPRRMDPAREPTGGAELNPDTSARGPIKSPYVDADYYGKGVTGMQSPSDEYIKTLGEMKARLAADPGAGFDELHDAQIIMQDMIRQERGYVNGRLPSPAEESEIAQEAARRVMSDVRANNILPEGATPALTRTAGVPQTPQQAAKFETPGSPEYEAAIAKGLDMSTPARMARAKEMGFDTDTPVYRGLTRPYDADTLVPGRFQFLAHDPEVANGYARNFADRDGANVVKAFLRKPNPLEVDAGGANWDRIDTRNLPEELRAILDPRAAISSIATAAKSRGYGHITIRNVVDQADGGIGSPTTVEVVFDPANIRSVNAAFDPDKAASPILTAGAGGKRPPKPDSPDAIKNALRDIAKAQPKEPTRLERMVKDNQIPVNSPDRVAPDAVQSAGNRAQRMAERGKDPFEIYDETSIVFVPYNGKNIPIYSTQQGPEEVIRTFYSWLREPKETWPQFVTDIVNQAPKKRTMRLGDENAAAVPPGAIPEPPPPMPKARFPYGGAAIGAGLGMATGIPGGALIGYAMTQRDRKPRNALAAQ